MDEVDCWENFTYARNTSGACDRCTNSSSFKSERRQCSVRSQTVEVTSKAVRQKLHFCIQIKNPCSVLRTEPRVDNWSAVLTGKPTLMKRTAKLHLGGNPPLLISDPRISLWYCCCCYINLNPSRLEWGVLAAYWRKNFPNQSRNLGHQGYSWSVFFIYLFLQTLTNLLKIPTEPSSQLWFVSACGTLHPGLASSRHQSDIKDSGCTRRGWCGLKILIFLNTFSKKKKQKKT